MKPQRTLLLLLTAASITLPSLHAQLAKYEFDSQTRASTDSDLTSTASNLINGTGITAAQSSYNTSVGSPAAPSLATDVKATGPDAAGAITGNDYYEFTLTPMTGFQANLSSLTFDYAIAGRNITGNFFVRSSIDTFGSTIGFTATTSSTTFNPHSISLTAPQYQGLTAPVTFRIYIFDSNDGNNRSDLLDNILLNGNVSPIPEPSTYAMMGLGVGLLGAVQRFRRRRA